MTCTLCIIIYYLLSCTVWANWRDNLKKVKRFLFQTLEWQIVHLPPPFCLGVGGKGVRLADVHEWPRKKVWFDPGGCQTQYQATGTETTCPFTKTWSDEVALAYCNHFFVHVPRCILPITMERERKSYKDGLAPATSPRHVGLNKSRSKQRTTFQHSGSTSCTTVPLLHICSKTPPFRSMQDMQPGVPRQSSKPYISKFYGSGISGTSNFCRSDLLALASTATHHPCHHWITLHRKETAKQKTFEKFCESKIQRIPPLPMWDVASCHSEYKNHLMHRSWVFQLCHGRETHTKKIALFPLICFVVLFLCGFKMTQGWRDVRVQKWTTNYGYKHSSRWGMGKIDCSHVPSRSDRSLGRYPRILLSMGHRIFNHEAYTQCARPSKFGSTTFHAGKNKRRIRHSADLYEHVWFPLSFPDPGESNGGKEAEKKMCDLTISILVFPLQFAQISSVLVCQSFRSRCVSIFSGCYLLAHVRKESHMFEMLRTKKGGLQHPELQPLNCQIAMFASLALCGSVWILGDRNIDGEFVVDRKVLCFFPCQFIFIFYGF